MTRRDALLAQLARRGPVDGIRGRRVLVSSTDVHEFAEFLLASTLTSAGAEVIDFGINRDPEDIVKVAVETDADAIVVTTHNGVAGSFAERLVAELRGAGLGGKPVYMGGVLNEDIEGSDVPIDVREDLRRLGVHLPDTIDQLVADLAVETSEPSPTP
jgi:methylmalonyl-CoA mutase cobalamin-binding domain/chain